MLDSKAESSAPAPQEKIAPNPVSNEFDDDLKDIPF